MQEFTLDGVFGPHAHTQVLMRGNTKNPRAALILMHGRGASAFHIISILDTISLPDHLTVLVPQAKDQTWFPNRFFDARAQNEPHLTSALSVIGALVEDVQRRFGVGTNDVTLAGFSQGASLVAEYLVEQPAQFNGACVYSGGLLGTNEDLAALKLSNSLLQTPVYMGCDIADPHVPIARFQKSRDLLQESGAMITYREYEGLRHAIHPEGLQFLGQLIHIR